MNESTHKININTADSETLTSLPGVGPALAEGIIQGRPYTSPDQILEVNGIGPTALARLREHMTTGEEAPPPPEESAPPMEEDTSPGEDSPPPSRPADRGAERFTTRFQLWTVTLSASAATFLITLLVTLTVLILFNGSLRYTSPARLESAEEQIEAQAGRINLLEERLKQVDDDSARIDQLEDALAELSGTLDEIDQSVKSLQSNHSRLMDFIKDIGDLFEGYFSGREGQ